MKPEIVATIVGDKATVEIRRSNGIVSLRWIGLNEGGVERVNKMPVRDGVDAADTYARKIATLGDAFA